MKPTLGKPFWLFVCLGTAIILFLQISNASPVYKMDCAMDAHWLDEHGTTIKQKSMNTSVVTIHPEYDFGWHQGTGEIAHWEGPQGMIRLMGSTNFPQENWIGLHILLELANMPAATNKRSEWVAVKLAPGQEFYISKRYSPELEFRVFCRVRK